MTGLVFLNPGCTLESWDNFQSMPCSAPSLIRITDQFNQNPEHGTHTLVGVEKTSFSFNEITTYQ